MVCEPHPPGPLSNREGVTSRLAFLEGDVKCTCSLSLSCEG